MNMTLLPGLFIFLLSFPTLATDCIRLINETQGRTLPDKKWITFKAGESFKIIKKSSDGKLVYAVQKNIKAVFKMSDAVEELCLHSEALPADALTIETADKSLQEKVETAQQQTVQPVTVPPSDPASPPSQGSTNQDKVLDPLTSSKKIRFNVNYSLQSSVSASPYSGLITPIPDPSDVSSLQDPLIVDISKGSGTHLRIGATYTLMDTVDLLFHLGQRKLKYTYQQKSNPSVSPVALGSLSTSERSFDINHYTLGFGGRYFFTDFSSMQIRFFIGGETEILYATSSEIAVSAFVGNLFKNTPTTVRNSVEQLTVDGNLNFGLQWYFLDLSIGLTPNQSTSLTLGGSIAF